MAFGGFINFLVLITLPFVVMRGAAAADEAAPPNCRKGLIVDCRLSHEDILWTTDDQLQCKVIANRCVFNNANCSRYRQGQPLLKEIPKSDCQKLCSKECPSGQASICASRANNFCNFSSECDWNKHICNTGEIWSKELDRFCVAGGSANVCP